MTPVALLDLLAADRIGALKAAIVARLASLLPGVTVVDHPGKVDVSDIVAKAVVATPGVAVGWAQLRPIARAPGGADTEISAIAYVVVEDKVIGTPPRRVERERLGLAIGGQILRILGQDGGQRWGVVGITPAEGAALKPLFTVRAMAEGVAYYAVTWTQVLLDAVPGPFEGLPVGEGDPETAVVQYDSEEDLERALAGILAAADAEDAP